MYFVVRSEPARKSNILTAVLGGITKADLFEPNKFRETMKINRRTFLRGACGFAAAPLALGAQASRPNVVIVKNKTVLWQQ